MKFVGLSQCLSLYVYLQGPKVCGTVSSTLCIFTRVSKFVGQCLALYVYLQGPKVGQCLALYVYLQGSQSLWDSVYHSMYIYKGPNYYGSKTKIHT